MPNKNFQNFIFNRGDLFPFFVTLVDVEAHDQPLIYANKFFKDFTQYKDSEILGRNCRFLQHNLDPKIRKDLRVAVGEFHPICRDLVNYKKDGEKFYNRLILIPIRGSKPTFLGLQNVITEAQFGKFPELSDSEMLDKTINPLTVLLLADIKDTESFSRHFKDQVERIKRFMRVNDDA